MSWIMKHYNCLSEIELRILYSYIIMEFVWGTNKSLALAQLCNIGIAAQLYNRNDKLDLEIVVASIIAGLYLADLSTGLFHLYFDTYKGSNIYLKNISEDFIKHHTNPSDIKEWPLIYLFVSTTGFPLHMPFLLYNTTKYTSTKQIIIQLK